MTALLAALLLAVAAPVPAPAPAERAPAAEAEVTQQAKLHFRRGTELYRQARYREAIVEFEVAYRLRPHGVIQYNLAQCHERLGDLAAALGAYHEYLRAVPDAEDRATVNAAMSNLAARLGASGVQQLLVHSDPAGAEVIVDGQARGRTPFSAALPLGTHRLEVVQPGYATVRRETLLTPDRSVELDLSLAREEPAGARGRPDLSVHADGKGAPALVGDPLAPPPALTTTYEHGRRWTWVAAGVAGAALAGGIAYGLAARSASDQLRSSEHTGATAQQLADSASARSRNANVLYGVAAAAGAASVTLFFYEGRF